MEKQKDSLYQAVTKSWKNVINTETSYVNDLEFSLELHKKLLDMS
jgi:hypothetical protein